MPWAWRDWERTVLFLALTGIGAAALVLLYRLSDFFHDDAFISLRYARNLALHGELAWNRGELVEGYTNPLHVLISSVLIRAGVEGMTAVRMINFAALALLVPLCWRISAMAGPALLPRVTAMAAVLGAPVIGWAFGGLESVLAAMFVAAALCMSVPVLLGRDRIAASLGASAFFALAYLTRPDTLILNLAAGLGLLVFADIPLRRRFLHVVATGLVSATVLAAHLAVRHAVYGEWLPLTFHAKVSVDAGLRLLRGAEYVLLTAWHVPTLVLGMALAAGSLRRPAGPDDRHAPLRRVAAFALLVVAAHLAYLLWSGGDHMLFARIAVPAIPAIVLLTAATLALRSSRAAGAIAVCVGAIAVAQAALRPVVPPDPAAAVGSVVGRAFAHEFPPGQTIALATAGSIPYFADMHVYIDTLGLNNPVIAKRDPVPVLTRAQTFPGHGKGDGAYVLARRPDIIIVGPAAGSPITQPMFLTDAELAALPEFAACYSLHQMPLEPYLDGPLDTAAIPPGLQFTYYRRTCP